ncbi:PAS domain S-box protein [Ideonella sp. YS5]|uniref:sensor domain-containing protein n=1 Tax=Ideonella sp. YS5 TaxID=3453714 RepID=UPI003EE897EE
MRTSSLSTARAVGLLVALLGATLALRWVFQIEAITRLVPGSEHLGIVNPLLFIAAAVCLCLACRPSRPPGWPARLSAACAAALVVLPLGYLVENVFDVSLGIDFVRAGTLPTAGNPHPGRISPNASLAFLLAGIAFWIEGRRPTPRRQFAYLVLTLAVSALGLAGLAGHLLGLETLYHVASFNRMLPSTAFGLSLLGVGLWMLREASLAFDAKQLQTIEQRIKRRSVAVITLVAVAGGIAGFAVMRDTFERSVAKDMLLVATTNATSLAHTIDVSLWFPRTVTSRPAARQALDKLSKAPGDEAAMDFLQKVADSFLTADLTGVEIYAANGELVAQAGSKTPANLHVIQRLAHTDQPSVLAWSDGYLLLADTDVRVDGRLVGRVHTEQRMPLFDRLLADIRASAATSDVAICGRANDRLVCAPNRYRPAGFELPMFDAAGQPSLPAAKALLGEQGVQFLKDRRGTNVLSAYTPIKDFGLGLAVRTDVDLLYSPLKSRLNLLALALLGIVALALYAQHSQVRPVLRQLVASEKQLKAILEDQSELVSLARTDGELLYVNPAYARHYGLTPAAMVGQNLFDHVAPADRESVRQAIAERLATGTTATIENRTLATDGSVRWVSWTNSVQYDTSGEPRLHSVGRDVTERKSAEQALSASQALLARMGRVAGVGGWEVDLVTGIHSWTEETRRIHDVGPDYVPTMDGALAFYTPEARQAVDAAVKRGIEQGTHWDLELPMVTATGRSIWVHAQGEVETEDGRPVRLVGSIQDVTERMLAEQAMRALTAIFDATTDYVVQLDTMGRITYMNPAARRRTGRAREESIEGLTLADLNPEQTLERFMSEVWPATLSKGVWVGESLVWDESRREFPVSHIVIAHRNKEGRIESFSALMRDISAAKAAEQALRHSEHRLRMVTDNLPVLISYLDRDLRFRFVNQTYREWFGPESAPQVGTTVREFHGERAWAEVEPLLQAALAGQQVAFDREMVTPYGRRHVHVSVVPDRNETGEIEGLYTLTGDVTSYRQAQGALQESEARLRTVADALPMRVAYIDAEERYRFNNLAYERGFGRPRDELIGKSVRELLGDSAYQVVEPHIRRALRGESVTFESEMAGGAGHTVCYEAHYIPQLAADGRTVLGFHAVITDITRQKVEERRLIELSRVDPLTGLVNRTGFELRVAEAMQHCRVTGSPMALMYLDIDKFKQINDRFGHDMGDALLRAFAARLSQTLRSTDTIARLGGDEFTVIMEGVPRPEVAATVANKIVQAMNTPFTLGQQTVRITTSIGLSFFQGDATTVEALVKQADVMLYRAKEAGRNNVQMTLGLEPEGPGRSGPAPGGEHSAPASPLPEGAPAGSAAPPCRPSRGGLQLV